MKNLVYFLLIITISYSCKNKLTDNEFDYSNTFDYNVEESDVSFILPKGYSKKTFSEYKTLILESELAQEIKDSQFKIIENIKSKFPNIDLFIEMSSLQNLIWILRKTPRVELNQDAVTYIGQTFRQVKREDNLAVYKEKIISSKLYFKKKYKYVQIRTKQNTINGERYLTHYFISTKKNSFGISFANIEYLNFQDYVNRIKL